MRPPRTSDSGASWPPHPRRAGRRTRCGYGSASRPGRRRRPWWRWRAGAPRPAARRRWWMARTCTCRWTPRNAAWEAFGAGKRGRPWAGSSSRCGDAAAICTRGRAGYGRGYRTSGSGVRASCGWGTSRRRATGAKLASGPPMPLSAGAVGGGGAMRSRTGVSRQIPDHASQHPPQGYSCGCRMLMIALTWKHPRAR